MPTTTQLDKSQISSTEARHVEETLRLIGRKWSTCVIETLTQQRAAIRVCDIAAHLPFVGNIYGILATMHSAGLVTQSGDHTGVSYQLSQRGRDLFPVHRALSEWSQQHFSLGEMAAAERAEDAARRLHLRQSTAVVQALDIHGSMPLIRVAEETGLGQQYALRRLERLHIDGVVARSGPHIGAPHVLTDAGRALGPVYAAAERWSAPDIHAQETESGR